LRSEAHTRGGEAGRRRPARGRNRHRPRPVHCCQHGLVEQAERRAIASAQRSWPRIISMVVIEASVPASARSSPTQKPAPTPVTIRTRVGVSPGHRGIVGQVRRTSQGEGVPPFGRFSVATGIPTGAVSRRFSTRRLLLGVGHNSGDKNYSDERVAWPTQSSWVSVRAPGPGVSGSPDFLDTDCVNPEYDREHKHVCRPLSTCRAPSGGRRWRTHSPAFEEHR